MVQNGNSAFNLKPCLLSLRHLYTSSDTDSGIFNAMKGALTKPMSTFLDPTIGTLSTPKDQRTAADIVKLHGVAKDAMPYFDSFDHETLQMLLQQLDLERFAEGKGLLPNRLLCLVDAV